MTKKNCFKSKFTGC